MIRYLRPITGYQRPVASLRIVKSRAMDWWNRAMRPIVKHIAALALALPLWGSAGIAAVEPRMAAAVPAARARRVLARRRRMAGSRGRPPRRGRLGQGTGVAPYAVSAARDTGADRRIRVPCSQRGRRG